MRKLGQILPTEQKILSSLTKKDIALIKRLKRDHLEEDKKRIVGFRSEDLFTFFENIKRGYILVGESPFMYKDFKNGLYLTPNPEYNLENFGINGVGPCAFPDFHDSILQNSAGYSGIAIKAGIFRNLISRLDKVSRKRLETVSKETPSEINKKQEHAQEAFYEGVSRELFKNFVRELEKRKKIPFEEESSFRITNILRKELEKSIPIQEIDMVLGCLYRRMGVFVGFNEKLFEKYPFYIGKVNSSQYKGYHEIVFDIKGGKLGLETIAGFEPCTIEEETVLQSLN